MKYTVRTPIVRSRKTKPVMRLVTPTTDPNEFATSDGAFSTTSWKCR